VTPVVRHHLGNEQIISLIAHVAKGIERSEQFEILRLNQCNKGQGHFIGLPKSTKEIGPYLHSTDAVTSAA